MLYKYTRFSTNNQGLSNNLSRSQAPTGVHQALAVLLRLSPGMRAIPIIGVLSRSPI
jgi:hypothetical protein